MAPATPPRGRGDDGIRARRNGDGGVRARREVSVSPANGAQVAGFARGRIAELQRARILAAMLDSANGVGAGSVSVADVVERSGVSRRTFYELFVDREDCFSAAFEQALADASDRVIQAFNDGESWQQKVRAGLVALLSFFDSRPQAGRVLITESLAGGPKVGARRKEAIGQLTRIVEEGAGEAKTAASLPPLTGEGVVGGVLAVIQRRLSENTGTPLVELTNPLMSMIVLPYLGSSAARRELKRATPMPVSQEPERTLVGDPFKGAGMRLTYRTVRVLLAVAEHPDGSNRLIADAAEIKDQGQISKLLTRLQRAGMVTNSGLGPGTGAPNAWTLTPSGREIAHSIRTHTTHLQGE